MGRRGSLNSTGQHSKISSENFETPPTTFSRRSSAGNHSSDYEGGPSTVFRQSTPCPGGMNTGQPQRLIMRDRRHSDRRQSFEGCIDENTEVMSGDIRSNELSNERFESM